VRIPRLLALGLAVLALAGCTGSATSSPSATAGANSGTNPGAARQELSALVVSEAQSMAGYTRERFPHWSGQGNHCDTRDVVLKRDGQGVVTDAECKITKGSWLSVYDNMSYTDPQKLDVDHVVPLANAWRSGANKWTDPKRQEFANDLTRPQLRAVSASQNRAKGDQDPSQWKPANRAFWCRYAQDWITVKHFWGLTVTAAEKTALNDMLGTCQ
jgi:hypothetical protein